MAEKSKVDTESIAIDKNAIGTPGNQLGSPLGYYSLSLFSNMNNPSGAKGCGSTPFYTEGFATGKCLPTATGGIKYDCSGPNLPPPTTGSQKPPFGVSSAGVYVTTFSSSACTPGTGTVAYVIPMGQCTPFNQNMLNYGGLSGGGASPTTAQQQQQTNVYGALSMYADYAMASCTALSPAMPGIPVKPDNGNSAIVESTYSSSGACSTNSSSRAYAQSLNGNSGQLPDTFKAFIQTPISTKSYTQPGCIVGVANTNANYKISFPSAFTIPPALPGAPVVPLAGFQIPITTMTAHVTPNFDWACFAPAAYPSATTGMSNTVLYNSLSGANALLTNQCYGQSTSALSASTGYLQPASHPLLQLAGTVPSGTAAGGVQYPNITSVAKCRQVCNPIFPRCGKPTGQPSMRPSNQPTSYPTTKTYRPTTYAPSKAPTSAPTSAPTATYSSSPTFRPPTGQPTTQPTRHPSMQPTMHPSTQPSSEPTGRPSMRPTMQPTQQPSQQPSSQPSQQPTQQPTRRPTQQPTRRPTQQPTRQPSRQPTQQPTMQPSRQPTSRPSMQPSRQPTSNPSKPSSQPSMQPSMQPSGKS